MVKIKLERDFYARETLTVAKDLLGKYLIHRVAGEELIGQIVEVEAYKGIHDKACHSYGGRRTPRNEIMYGVAGKAYVYLIYGMYNCFNIVTSDKGNPEAVLIRALKPIQGIEKMQQGRYKKVGNLSKQQFKNLLNGPGKLCQGMHINRSHNGLDLVGDKIYLLEQEKTIGEIMTAPRINIDYAEEAVHYPWRFYLADSPFISRSS